MPRSNLGRFAALFAPLALCAAGQVGAAPPRAPVTDLARMENGEILLSSMEVGNSSFKVGIGRALIPAPIDRVIRAVADVAHYEEFMPFLESSTAATQPDGSILSRQRLDLPVPLGTRKLTVRFEATRTNDRSYLMVWTSMPGSEVRDQHGSFSLEAVEGATLVTCRFFLDPGGAAAFLVNRETERSVGWILDGLRQHVRRGRYDRP